MNSALEKSLDFDFTNKPRISSFESVNNETLDTLQTHVLNEIYPYLFRIHPTYWGNSCQFLSSHIFAILSSQGIVADIVYGEVEVNGTLEFDTSLDELKSDFHAPDLTRGQNLHAWVSIGGDTIIDAGLPDRMIKNYKFPEKHMPPILIGRASDLSRTYRTRHQPILVGTDFLAKTNPPDPLKLMDIYSK